MLCGFYARKNFRQFDTFGRHQEIMDETLGVGFAKAFRCLALCIAFKEVGYRRFQKFRYVVKLGTR